MLNSQCILTNVESEMDEGTFEQAVRSMQFENLTSFCFLSLLMVRVGGAHLLNIFPQKKLQKLIENIQSCRKALLLTFAVLLVNCFPGTALTSEQLSRLCSIRKHNV